MGQAYQDIFDGLENIAFEAKNRKRELNMELSKVDKEISDIKHFIEFHPLNACQGYKMAKMLQECLKERRSIKDESAILDRILRMSVGYIGKGTGRSELENVKINQYQPRVLKELFDNPNE